MSRVGSHPSFHSTVHWGVLALLICGLLTNGALPAAAATTTRASVASDGTEANASSEWCAISGDGRYIVYSAMASNLVPGDVNNRRDIFVYDRETGATELESVTTAGVQSGADCRVPHISADGHVVAFESAASNLAPGAVYGRTSAYVHDRITGVTELVSVSGAGVLANDYSGEARLSADGRFVVFSSYGSNLVSGDTNAKCDIFLRDRLTGTTERISVSTVGTEGDGNSGRPHISADGRYVTFYSDATNLVASDTNGVRDVFVRDRLAGTTERVSVATDGTEGNNVSGDPTLSADGRYVVFYSLASNFFAPDDTNNQYDIFVHDRDTGVTQIVSVTPAGQEGSSTSNYATISADGRYVAFFSWASNLVSGDTNGAYDVLVRDRQAGVTQRASVSTAGAQGNSQSMYPWLSGDGQWVAFMSSATNLVDGDTNAVNDMFVRGRLWNTAPTAQDDEATTDEDTAVSVAVLDNDSDGEGDTLTIDSVTQPEHGTATINGTSVDYAPAENYNGADSFTYTVSDGNGGTATATVSITVNSVNDAPELADPSAQTVAEGASLSFTLSATDPDNDPLTYSADLLPAGATLDSATGAFSWTPGYDQAGPYSIFFTVSDGDLTASQTVAITVTDTSTNQPPVAAFDCSAWTALPKLPVYFTDLSSDSDGAIAAWAWDFGDGATSTEQNPAHGYTALGAFTVTLTVTDDDAATATISHDVTVVGNTPVGSMVKVKVDEKIEVTFAEIKKSGQTEAKHEPVPPPDVDLPAKVKVIEEEGQPFSDIKTTAEYEGPVEVEKEYKPEAVPEPKEKNEKKLEMWKYKTEEKKWVEVTKEVDTVEKKVKGESDSLSWYVIGLPLYDFCGFLPPVGDADGRPFKKGSTIPIKFRISDGGQPVTDAVATLAVCYLVAGATAGEPEVASTAAGDAGNQFRYSADDDLYIYNLSTKNSTFLAPYTYRALVTLDDGSTHAIDFALKK